MIGVFSIIRQEVSWSRQREVFRRDPRQKTFIIAAVHVDRETSAHSASSGAAASSQPAFMMPERAPERTNQKWLADFTYIWTAQGWLYVAPRHCPRTMYGWLPRGKGVSVDADMISVAAM